MSSTRFLTVFAFAAGVGFIVANCGGSDSSSSGNGLTCPDSTGSGSCSPDQTKAYGECVQNKCDAQYQMCLGSGYKSGSFGGPCGSWIGCYAKCNCDKNCQAMCGAPPAECTTCLFQIAPCQQSSGCTPPVCNGTGGSGGGGASGTGGSGGGGAGGSGGGGGTCADLMKCCNSITNAQQKAQCQQTLAGVMAGGDQACGGALAIFRASKICQ